MNSDLAGPITTVFPARSTYFSAYFTYNVPLSFVFYDSFNAIASSQFSAFANNTAGVFGDPGSSPNEQVTFALAGGISSVTITPNVIGGGAFTMDDLTFTPLASAAPEPTTGGLLAGSLALYGILRVTSNRRPRGRQA